MSFLHVKDTVSILISFHNDYKSCDNYDKQYHIIYDMCRTIELAPRNVQSFIGDDLRNNLNTFKLLTLENRLYPKDDLATIYDDTITPLISSLIEKTNNI